MTVSVRVLCVSVLAKRSAILNWLSFCCWRIGTLLKNNTCSCVFMSCSFNDVTKSSLHMHIVHTFPNDVMFWYVRTVCATYVTYVWPKLWVTSFSVSVSVSVQLRPIVSGIGRQHGIGLTLILVVSYCCASAKLYMFMLLGLCSLQIYKYAGGKWLHSWFLSVF